MEVGVNKSWRGYVVFWCHDFSCLLPDCSKVDFSLCFWSKGYLRSDYAAALWSGLTVIVFIIIFFSQTIWHTAVFLISDKVCLSFLIFLIYSMQNVRFLANFITEAGIIIKRSKVKMRPYTRINARGIHVACSFNRLNLIELMFIHESSFCFPCLLSQIYG